MAEATMGPATPSDPLPVHPDVISRPLENGLDVWLRPHRRPPGAVAICLYLRTGSLHEAADECGISHLLEHLAFEGGRHYSAGGMRDFLADQGMRLGQQYNAFTGRESTRYTLLLPHSGEAAVRGALACCADFAHGLQLSAAAVEQERQVILAELRQEERAKRRVRERILDHLLAGSRFLERPILGRPDDVRRLTRDQLVAFYRRRYRPRNAVLLMVGDFDAEQAHAWVDDALGGWPTSPTVPSPSADGAPNTMSPNIVPPNIVPPSTLQGLVVSEPEQVEGTIRRMGVRPAIRLRRTDDLRRLLLDELAFWLVNRRLGAMLRQGRTPFEGMRLGRSPLLRDWSLTGAILVGRQADWRAMTSCLAHELQRVDEHGFLAQEVEEARSHLISQARQGVLEESNSVTDRQLTTLLRAVPEARPPMSAAQRLATYEDLLPELGGAGMRQALMDDFPPSSGRIVAVVPSVDADLGPDAETLLDSWRAARGATTQAPRPRWCPETLLSRPPALGTVADEQRHEGLGVTSWILANGIRVHLKPTSFRQRRVFMELTLVGGRLHETPATLGLTAAAALPFSQPAGEGLSSLNIRDWLTHRQIRLLGAAEEDAIGVRCSCNSEDFESALELLHVLLTAPIIESSIFARWQEQAAQREARQGVSLEARMALESMRLVSGGDPRFGLVSSDHVRSLELSAAQHWLRSACTTAPMELAICGDFEIATAREWVCKYLGSLEPRPLEDSNLASLRRLAPAPGPLRSDVDVAMASPRGGLLMAWRAAPWADVEARLVLQMAAQVLRLRLHKELREERALSYSFSCSYGPSKGYPAASLLSVAFDTTPERLDEGADATRRVTGELARTGPDEAELGVVQRQLVEQIRKLEREPQYWARLLNGTRARGIEVSRLQDQERRVLDATVEDVGDILRRYIVPDGRLEVRVSPQTRGAEGAAENG